MKLSNDLVTQFAKLAANKTNTNKETIVSGKAIKIDGATFVQLDGSDTWTPVSTTATVKAEQESDAERVTVLVKDHTATIIGNTSSPSASSKEVEEHGNKIDEFDIIVSYKVTTDELVSINASIETLKGISLKYENMEAVKAEIETLESTFATIDHVAAEEVTAINAQIENIKAMFGEFTNLEVSDLEAVDANISNLQAYTANFTYVSTEMLKAFKAEIENLDVEKLDVNFANIDYANIDKATFEEFYAKSGLIENVVADDATVTGYLIGVTIKGDLIEAGTLVADKLVIKGEDGLYYKLNTNGETTESEQTEYNSLNGSIITAKSVTAEKIQVSDLVAFGATIGNFKIGTNSIYSGIKDSINNTTNGIFMGDDGQIYIGDNGNYLKYYRDENDDYRFAIAAESISFGVGKKFTLDDNGMTIEGTSDETNNTVKTQVSNNGMTIYGNEKEVLIANDKGVKATDLDADTYLIIGGRSRFENIPGDNRTGCFWIAN